MPFHLVDTISVDIGIPYGYPRIIIFRKCLLCVVSWDSVSEFELKFWCIKFWIVFFKLILYSLWVGNLFSTLLSKAREKKLLNACFLKLVFSYSEDNIVYYKLLRNNTLGVILCWYNWSLVSVFLWQEKKKQNENWACWPTLVTLILWRPGVGGLLVLRPAWAWDAVPKLKLGITS